MSVSRLTMFSAIRGSFLQVQTERLTSGSGQMSSRRVWTRALAILVPASEVVKTQAPYRGSEAVWLPTAADGEATHFTVLLSKPGAARGRRGFPSAEGYENSTELVTRLDLTTGEQVWLLAHNEPMTDQQVAHVRFAREHVAQFGRDAIRAGAQRKPDFQPRAVTFGDISDGAAYLIDVSLQSLLEAA